MALAALLLGVIAAPATAGGVPPPPPPPPSGAFSCTASVLRVNLLGSTIEPLVANAADKPCVDDSSGLVGPIAVGPLSINGLLTASTKASGHAEASILRAVVGVGALVPAISADVLTSSTDVSCKNGQPSFSSSGDVVKVRIGSLVIQVPANQGAVVLNIPLVGTLYLNQVVTTPTSITRRALYLHTLIADVVIAESKSDVSGNPCHVTPPPPPPKVTQCNDGIDNDGDKKIDVKDPGCHSGPGGMYNPHDNDETDPPPPPPPPPGPPPPPPPPPPPTGKFSCTASVLRVTLLGSTIEPIVANPDDSPCADDSTGLVGPLAIGPLSINGVLIAGTKASKTGGHAESSVLKAAIGVGPVIPAVTADVLTSSTDVTCKNGRPTFSSSGDVVNVRIGTLVIQIPANQGAVVLDIPLVGTLYLNEVVTTPTSITRRALRLHTQLLNTQLLDVVVAESKSDISGKPCKALAPPPPHSTQCSDGIDNDGDKKVDNKDPGCKSGPGGSYNPKDDDERDTPPPPPQCYDGKDNDGDKTIDRSDPQCHSDGNAKNDKSYVPSDSDESK
jgi:hypothetical protein